MIGPLLLLGHTYSTHGETIIGNNENICHAICAVKTRKEKSSSVHVA
jgi:hypothetical protein